MRCPTRQLMPYISGSFSLTHPRHHSSHKSQHRNRQGYSPDLLHGFLAGSSSRLSARRTAGGAALAAAQSGVLKARLRAKSSFWTGWWMGTTLCSSCAIANRRTAWSRRQVIPCSVACAQRRVTVTYGTVQHVPCTVLRYATASVKRTVQRLAQLLRGSIPKQRNTKRSCYGSACYKTRKAQLHLARCMLT